MSKAQQTTQKQTDTRAQLIDSLGLQNILIPDEKDHENQRFICLKCPIHNKNPASFNVSNLKKHLKSTKHYEVLDSVQKAHLQSVILKLEEFETKPEANQSNQIVTKKKTASLFEKTEKLKLRFSISEFLIKERLPFSIAPRLTEFIQRTNTSFSQDTLRRTTLSKTTAKIIIQDCIAQTLKEKIFAGLRSSPFSISLDESTDKFGKNYLAIFVKYIDSEHDKQPTTKLLSIVQMQTSYTGKTIFEEMKKQVLFDEEIALNFVGIATDQAKSLTSEGIGLAGHVKNKYPYAIYVNDLSHIFNLIIKEGIKTFPAYTEQLVSKICSHFSKSPQRRAKLEQIQAALGVDRLEVLRYVNTRWLSFRDAGLRILRIWKSLTEYARIHKMEVKLNLTNKNKAYLQVLMCLVDKLAYYNVEFQTTHLFYNKIFDLLEESFNLFAQLISVEPLSFTQAYQLPWTLDQNNELDRNVLSDADFFNTFIEENFLEEDVQILDHNTQQELATSAKKFILKTLCEMKKRLPYNQEILKDLKAIFFEKCDKVGLRRVLNQFSNIISSSEQRPLQNEIERFSTSFEKIRSVQASLQKTPLEIWFNEKQTFPILYRLAKAVMVLPHTTVPVERAFSKLKDFKTGKRNKLLSKTIESCLLSFQSFGDGAESITTQPMLERYHQAIAQTKVLASTSLNNQAQVQNDQDQVVLNPEAAINPMVIEAEQIMIEKPSEDNDSSLEQSFSQLLSIEEERKKQSEEEARRNGEEDEEEEKKEAEKQEKSEKKFAIKRFVRDVKPDAEQDKPKKSGIRKYSEMMEDAIVEEEELKQHKTRRTKKS